MTTTKLNENVKRLTNVEILKTNMFGEESFETECIKTEGCKMNKNYKEIWKVVLNNMKEIKVIIDMNNKVELLK